MAELFSEIYGCYYNVVSKILNEAHSGITRKKIEEIIKDHAFSDSAFYIMPRLFSYEWDLLNKENDIWYSKLNMDNIKRPMTNLEKAWIKALLSDKRIQLFISADELLKLSGQLSDIEPLFYPDDFYTFDLASDGDNYDDKSYQENFKLILTSIIEKKALHIIYDNGKRLRKNLDVLPCRLSYSAKDDKFRLLALNYKTEACLGKVTLNLSRIKSIESSSMEVHNLTDTECMFQENENMSLVALRISNERNALERFLLQFSSWDKQTEYDEESGYYICRIFYDKIEETELLIRILSFGPVVKVLSPDSFIQQVKERLNMQWERNK